VERDVPQRWFEVFEEFDKRDGDGVFMDFLRVGGSQENADQLLRSMLLCKLIEPKTVNGKACYSKTSDGTRVHELLKNRKYLGPLFKLLNSKRLYFE